MTINPLLDGNYDSLQGLLVGYNLQARLLISNLRGRPPRRLCWYGTRECRRPRTASSHSLGCAGILICMIIGELKSLGVDMEYRGVADNLIFHACTEQRIAANNPAKTPDDRQVPSRRQPT